MTVDSWIPVVVAIVGGGGPLMLMLARFDRRNTEQHGQNQQVLTRIEDKVDRLDGKVERVDSKTDRIDTRLERHINDDHR